MSHRLGVCSSCDAKYKIPSSFTANQAKCKSCGGVVNITDPGGAPKAAPPVPTRKVAPAPKPAARPAPKPVAQAAPKPAPKAPAMEEVRGSGKKRSGPSMKERLLAEREAAAAAQKSATKPTRRASATEEASARPARPARERSKAGSTRGKGRAVKESSRPSKARGSKRRGSEQDEIVVSEESTVRGRQAARSKRSPLLPLMSLGALVLAGVGIFLYMQQEDKPVDAADGTKTDTEMANAEAAGEGAAAAAENADPMTDEGATEEATPAEVDAETAEPEAEPEQPKPEKVKKGPDPDSVDLTAIEDFGPVDGMSEEDFQELVEKANLMIDPEAGAAGTRARTALIEAGRFAFPAMLNKFKTLDFSTDQGKSDGDLFQKSFEEICDGKNFGWRYTTEPKDVYFNKKVVVNWATNWRKAQDDMAHWDIMSGAKKKAEEAAKELGEDSMDDLDELDDF